MFWIEIGNNTNIRKKCSYSWYLFYIYDKIKILKLTLNVITCVTNGIPSKNSMKQIPAVNSIFFCRKYSGNSSTKAVVIVSNIPNWTERKIIVSFILFQSVTEIKVLKYNVQEKILAVLVKCLVLYFLFYRKWKIFIIFIFRLRSHLA